MYNTPLRGPDHSDDTYGDSVILVEFVAEMVPHDSPEFRVHAQEAVLRAIPDHLKPAPKPDEDPPVAT